jgi:hypothetical protein
MSCVKLEKEFMDMIEDHPSRDQLHNSHLYNVDMVKGRPIGRPLLFRVGVKDALSKLVVFKLLEPHFQMTEKTRLVVSEGEIAKLFTFFDYDRSGLVEYDEFIRTIRGPMNPARKAIV